MVLLDSKGVNYMNIDIGVYLEWCDEMIDKVNGGYMVL